MSFKGKTEFETVVYEHAKLQVTTIPQCLPTYTYPTNNYPYNYYFWDVNQGAPFNQSSYKLFYTKILQGLKLTSFFEYSNECTTQVFNSLSQIYFIKKNGTCNVPQFDQRKQIYYTSQVISTEFANSFYNCYLFTSSVNKVVNTRLNAFADVPDIITSFLFNLLSNSLQIKTITTSIKTYSAEGKNPELWGEFAKLFRIMLDFESANSAALSDIGAENTKSLNISRKIVDELFVKVMTAKLTQLNNDP